MLKVERLKIKIYTQEDTFGFDQEFSEGVNFIASEDNTYGKSSILLGIYYCLGFEEIIGSQGSKVLTPVYKDVINCDGKEIKVLQSEIFLQICNGDTSVTLYRTGKSLSERDDKLITVYESTISGIHSVDIKKRDFFVQSTNSANNERGFHYFLEKFLGISLPIVPTSDNSQRKLYLQLIFSCMLIEQKRGWADYYSAMPYFGIKDAKKRVAEFVLGLDQINNERKKIELKIMHDEIVSEWSSIIKDILYDCKKEDISIIDLPKEPVVLTKEKTGEFKVYINEDPPIMIEKKIEQLEYEINITNNIVPKIGKNYDELEVELKKTESSISICEDDYNIICQKLIQVNHQIEIMENNLRNICNDINDNNDLRKIKQLGSEEGIDTMKGICPLCKQKINDYAFMENTSFNVMSIEDNLKHLKAQKKTIEYMLQFEKEEKEILAEKKEKVDGSLIKLRRLYQTILCDTQKIDDDISETVIYKKIELQRKIEDLELFKKNLDILFQKLIIISKKWVGYLNEKMQLPEKGLCENDENIIKNFEKYFRESLSIFGFDSVVDKNTINISRELYIPIKDKFDMKFASSASDNIRAIWAYTLGLLQVSNQFHGNHPGLIIFDEPAQHSIIKKDLEALFDRINTLKGYNQIIVAVTMDDDELRSYFETIKSDHKVIILNEKALKKEM